ncbi:hypothetical protein FYV54_02555 [Campylobacter jejuni]|nr:hypothetical protein [Campylobacter jejuni]EJV0993353.1 hypothetical protein [Campylobacter jejuni]
MRKIIFILAFAFVIAILYVIFDFYVIKDSQKITKTDFSTPLTCDLNVKDCTYSFNNKKVLISLNPKPLQSLDVTNLKIVNLGNYNNLGIKIYGLNMYMGEIKPKIHRLNSTDYESKIVLAACVLDTMRFRVEFMDNNKPIGFYFDFELKK